MKQTPKVSGLQRNRLQDRVFCSCSRNLSLPTNKTINKNNVAQQQRQRYMSYQSTLLSRDPIFSFSTLLSVRRRSLKLRLKSRTQLSNLGQQEFFQITWDFDALFLKILFTQFMKVIATKNSKILTKYSEKLNFAINLLFGTPLA